MRWLLLGVVLSGCGLALDYDPPEPRAGGFDAGKPPDASRPRDAAMPECTVASDCPADGDVCNGVETCVEGRCVSISPLECDDGIGCTDDHCDPAEGCLHGAVDEACPNLDGADCTDERCDPATGCYVEIPPDACDDGIDCTLDVCDASFGAEACRHTVIDGFCGDAVCDPARGCVGTMCAEAADCPVRACQEPARCVAGRCESVALADGTPCDDGNPCSPSSACSGGECRGTSSTLCRGAPCVICNPTPGGGCDGSLVQPAGTPCDDGNRCTIGDSCSGATCVSTAGIACADDGNECTDDRCDPMTGSCGYPVVAGRTCEDGNACTHAQTCQADGRCAGGGLTTCPVGADPCVGSDCDPTSGLCVLASRDGARCGPDGTGTCTGGSCLCGGSDCSSPCLPGEVPCPTGCCPSACGTRCRATEVCCECTGFCFSSSCRMGCCFCPAGI